MILEILHFENTGSFLTIFYEIQFDFYVEIKLEPNFLISIKQGS